MADAVHVAYQRRKDYQTSIAKKKTEIEELEELIADLDSFIEFGESLTSKETDSASSKETVSVKAVSRPVPQNDAATTPASATNEKSAARPAAQDKPKSNGDVNPADEWATDDNKSGIARVLSQRIG